MQQGTRRHRLLVGLSVALILVVALSGPNAAKPDLRSGWPLDGLLPFTLSSALVTGLLWVAYAVAAVAIALALALPAAVVLPAGVVTARVIGGGEDVSPEHYGGDLNGQVRLDPARDALEMRWIRWALERGTPLLGICRGLEM